MPVRTATPLLVLLLLFLGTGPGARAQEAAPGGGVHAPPPDAEGSVGRGGGKAKGPNLRVPDELPEPVRERLARAIGRWERVYAALGRVPPQRLSGPLAEVVAELEACRKEAGKCALPYHYLGIAYQIRGLVYGDREALKKAVVRLKAAVRIEPAFHEALVELGDAHRHLGHEQEAEAAYGRALAAAPDYALAYRRRATLLLERGRFEEARADVEAARKLEPADAGLQALERKLKLVLEGPDWPRRYEAETAHYLVRTNVGQEFADEIAHQAELIRRLYEQVFPRGRKPKRKSPIVVFASKEEYHRNGGPRGAGGHFDPVFKQLFLFRYPKESDTRLVLYHEGFHQFLDAILDVKPPQWFNEGVADFFGPSRYVNEGGVEGMKMRPNPWRLKTIKSLVRGGKALPFQRLMTMSQQEMYSQNPGANYAQAWSIIYFLVRADDGAYHKYLKSYFKALRKGKDRFGAYEAAFGKTDMAALEERWRAFTLGLDAKE